jgi:hypothetical protein
VKKLALAMIPLLFLAGAACKSGGGSDAGVTPEASATPAPAGTTVTSDDGLLSLFIPDGAMPEGTEVSITSLANEELPPELQELSGSGTGYLLEPDGLEFSEPATATLTLSRSELDDAADSQTAYALVSFSETAGREVLDSETAYTVGEETVTVTSQIQHFSRLTRTKGSLRATLADHLFRRRVGETYELTASLSLFRGDLIMIEDVRLTWLASGVITLISAPNVNIGEMSGEEILFRNAKASFRCSEAGRGTDGFNVRGVSRTIAVPDLATTLAITWQEPVECAVGTLQPEPTPLPTRPPQARPVVHLVQTMGCEHTEPGRSKLLKKGRITDSAGLPVSDAYIREEAMGPGLLDEELANPSVRSLESAGLTDENGEFTIEWPINKYGTYTVVPSSILVGDALMALDETSTTSSTYTVSEACTPP